MVARFVSKEQRQRVSQVFTNLLSSQANTSAGAVILSKVDGSNVTEAEARGVLERYGQLEIVAPTSNTNNRNNTTTYGMFVKFAFYLDCRDALKVSSPQSLRIALPDRKQLFHHHAAGYNLYMAPSLEPRFRVGPDGNTVLRGFTQPRSVMDQKSIYVGNLPDHATKENLVSYFSRCGRVVDANIIKKLYGEWSSLQVHRNRTFY